MVNCLPRQAFCRRRIARGYRELPPSPVSRMANRLLECTALWSTAKHTFSAPRKSAAIYHSRTGRGFAAALPSARQADSVHERRSCEPLSYLDGALLPDTLEAFSTIRTHQNLSLPRRTVSGLRNSFYTIISTLSKPPRRFSAACLSQIISQNTMPSSTNAAAAAARDAAFSSFQRSISIILASNPPSNDIQRQRQHEFVRRTVQAFMQANGDRADEIAGMLAELHNRFDLTGILGTNTNQVRRSPTPPPPSAQTASDPMDLDDAPATRSRRSSTSSYATSTSSEESVASPPPRPAATLARRPARQAAPAQPPVRAAPRVAARPSQQSLPADTVFYCDVCQCGHRTPRDLFRHMRNGPGRAGFRFERTPRAGDTTWYGVDAAGSQYQGRIAVVGGRLQNARGQSCTSGQRRG